MLSAGNPYVLPAVVVAAAAYLGLTVLTDLSVFVRVGVLVGVGIALPIVLNRLFGGAKSTTTDEEAVEGDESEPADADEAA